MDPLEIAKGTFRAFAGQIPILGSVLTGLFEARAQELLQERLEEFLELLRQEATYRLEREYDKDYLNSQDYLHLILLTIEHARRTKQEEKRRLFARAILNAGTKEWAPRCDLAEELLNALADLSPTEIRVRQAAWDRCGRPSPDSPSRLHPLAMVVTAPQIAPLLSDLRLSEAEIGGYLVRLQRLGFVELVSIDVAAYGPSHYRLNPLFAQRLLELIRMPP
jgi:hypothetical protein